MKINNFMKKLSAALPVSAAFIFLFYLFSCSTVVSDSENSSRDGKIVKVSFSVADFTSEDRTLILPEKLTESAVDSFVLTGSLSDNLPDVDSKYKEVSETYTSDESKTAYQKLTAAKLELAAGVWNFKLKGLKYKSSENVLQTVVTSSMPFNISSLLNSIQFNLTEAESGYGDFTFDFTIPPGKCGKVSYEISTLESGQWKQIAAETSVSLSSVNDENGNEQNVFQISHKDFEKGYYFLRIYFYQDSAGTNQISRRTVYFQVAPGLKTSSVFTYSSLNTVYAINYDLQGGSWLAGASPLTEYNSFMNVTLPDSTQIARTGYTFGGWTKELKTPAESSETVSSWTYGSSNSDLTFYAVWIKNIYTITYDLQGAGWAEGFTPVTSYTIEDNVTLPDFANLPRTGYTFGGWYEKSDFSGSQISGWSSGEKSENLNLYAKWTANKYTVTFDSYGGSGTMEIQEFTYDVPQNLSACSFTKTDYTFGGWSLTAGGEKAYDDKASYSTGTENITLYAVWKIIDYRISYADYEAASGAEKVFSGTGKYIDSGTEKDLPSVYDSGTELEIPVPVSQSSKAVFKGWFKKSDCGTDSELSKNTGGNFYVKDLTEDLKLYAKWEFSELYLNPEAAETVYSGFDKSHPVKTLAEVNALSLSSGSTTVYLLSEYKVSDLQAIASTKDITIKRHSDLTGCMFFVTSSGNLQLSGYTLDGGAVWQTANDPSSENTGINASGAVIEIESGGFCSLSGGVYIVNNCNKNGSGGAVSCSGTLVTSSVKIQNNYAEKGGGVYVSGGTFSSNINEEEKSYIDHNCASSGGGIYAESGILLLQSGTVITENTLLSSSEGKGAGICKNGASMSVSGAVTVYGNLYKSEQNNIYIESTLANPKITVGAQLEYNSEKAAIGVKFNSDFYGQVDMSFTSGFGTNASSGGTVPAPYEYFYSDDNYSVTLSSASGGKEASIASTGINIVYNGPDLSSTVKFELSNTAFEVFKPSSVTLKAVINGTEYADPAAVMSDFAVSSINYKGTEVLSYFTVLNNSISIPETVPEGIYVISVEGTYSGVKYSGSLTLTGETK